jgi:hypothetical protein
MNKMADDGAGGAPAAASGAPAVSGGGGPGEPVPVPAHGAHAGHQSTAHTTNGPAIEEIASLTSPRLFTPNPFSRKDSSLDIDDYFVFITKSAPLRFAFCQELPY